MPAWSDRFSVGSIVVPRDLHARVGGAKPSVTIRVWIQPTENAVSSGRGRCPEASPKATRDVLWLNCCCCLRNISFLLSPRVDTWTLRFRGDRTQLPVFRSIFRDIIVDRFSIEPVTDLRGLRSTFGLSSRAIFFDSTLQN